MISLDEARLLIAQQVQPLDPTSLPLDEARGRVLRDDATAPEDLPAFDRSAMDGYAVALDDRSERFRVVAEIQPGVAPTVTLGLGECARIFTGAAIPAGASQVIMQEDTEREGDFMKPTRRIAATHIRHRGEDARRGSVLLKVGTRLAPAELALLAHVGITAPRVSPPVRAIHFTTGNELVPPTSQPAPGQIRDTNSTLVAGLLAERGTQLVHQSRCEDSLEALSGAIEAAGAGTWDLLLISGGASVGDYDFGARALERLGFTIHFRQMNLRPGKPLIFATRARQVAFVIPGNPVSHFVVFQTAITRAIECLEQAPASWPLASVLLETEISDGPNPRETWWPAHVALKRGAFIARPLAWQSSGDLCGLAFVNGLIRIPPRSQPLAAGANADCLLLDHRL
ncbi:MAG: molybdopterin molybdotransferase MoeA [Chthoniobacteraceae bacterium]